MLIGELADPVGLTSQTIRFYERKGLLPDAERGANGYRAYDQSILARLRFINAAQAAGLTLSEIRSVMELRDDGTVPCARGRADRHQAPRRTGTDPTFGRSAGRA